MIVTQGFTSLVKVCAVFTKKTVSNTNTIQYNFIQVQFYNYPSTILQFYPNTESSLTIIYILTTIVLYLDISIIYCNLHYVPQYYYGHKPIHFKLVTFKHLITSILHD